MPVKRQRPASNDQPKRTRFASPSASASGSGAGASSRAGRGRSSTSASAEPEDDLLQADLPEGAQAAKQRSRRQLQGAEGYDSDSSNDEDGVVFSRRKDKQEDGDGDGDMDVDMFGDDLPSDSDKGKRKGKGGDKGKGKGKEKEFLDIGDIEGQEFTREVSTPSDADADADEDEDEDARVARRKQGLDGDMGYTLTGFNMKDELEEGKFTADGETYVANKPDAGDKHDQWLTDLDDDAIRKARAAHREREKREAELQELESGVEGAARRREEEARLLRGAMGLMERGETVLEALQRLGREAGKGGEGGGNKKKSWAERQKERKAAAARAAESNGAGNGSEAGAGKEAANPFTALSDIVSALSTASQLDVYALSRESIQRMLPPDQAAQVQAQSQPQSSASIAASAAPAAPTPRDTRAFQYRFSMGYVRALPEPQRPVEREVFGPFPLGQLTQWRNTGFFGGPACENVELRTAGQEPGSWGTWDEVVGR